MKAAPVVGDTLYQFVDLMDDADSMCVVTWRVVKVQLRWTWLRSVRRNGDFGSQAKVAHAQVLRRFALTKEEAVLLLVDKQRAVAESARKSIAMADKLAERYLAFLSTLDLPLR